MDTKVRKRIESLRHLLSLEKNEEELFFRKQFRNFTMKKIEKSSKSGICWYPLSFINAQNQIEGRIVVSFQLPLDREEEHSFKPGSVIKIFQADTTTGTIIRMTDGLIELIRKEEVEVSYSAPQPFRWMEEEAGIGIRLSHDQYTYQVMEKALDNLCKASRSRLAQLRDIMLGKEQPLFSIRNEYDNEWLNQTQQMAVYRILTAQDIALVHGPPGTGKTTTLVAAIIETLKTERQVMVCAHSNIAVDTITEKLLEHNISVVRIGNPERITDELLKITYEAKYYEHPFYADILSCNNLISELQYEYAFTPPAEEIKRRGKINEIVRLRSRIVFLKSEIQSAIFKEHKVVAATMIGSANRLLKNISFSTVFIDEAAQALEPACWVAIAKAHRVIFAGDHKQLPPTIQSYEAAQAGLMNTLFEKIMERKPKCGILLRTQYRMHESIMNFSSQWFYNGGLFASKSVQNRKLIENDIPVEWIDTSLCQWHEYREADGTSIFNKQEVTLMIDTLTSYIEVLGASRMLDEKITLGIISPYSAQVDLLRKKIHKSKFFKPFLSQRLISIRTIDGFQGQERDIIAVSLVRSNAKSKIGFLADYRRINVAMTRARKKLFLIGDSSTLCDDPFYAALFSYIQENGVVTTVPAASATGDFVSSNIQHEL